MIHKFHELRLLGKKYSTYSSKNSERGSFQVVPCSQDVRGRTSSSVIHFKQLPGICSFRINVRLQSLRKPETRSIQVITGSQDTHFGRQIYRAQTLQKFILSERIIRPHSLRNPRQEAYLHLHHINATKPPFYTIYSSSNLHLSLPSHTSPRP